MRARGTCPVCETAGIGLRGDGKTLGSHSAPRSYYKDGRACHGTGLRSVEARARPYTGFRYPESREGLPG